MSIKGDKEVSKKMFNEKQREDMSVHIVVLYFLVVPPTVLN